MSGTRSIGCGWQPDAHPRRDAPGHLPHRDGIDRGQHRHADRDRRVARARSLRLGLLGLPPRLHRHRAALRPTGRHARPQAGLRGRDRDLPGRVGALGRGALDAAADHLPRHPGARRGRGAADRLHHPRRPLHAGAAGAGPGALQRGLGRVERGRTGPRRGDHRDDRLALDLLHQHPLRHRRHAPARLGAARAAGRTAAFARLRRARRC